MTETGGEGMDSLEVMSTTYFHSQGPEESQSNGKTQSGHGSLDHGFLDHQEVSDQITCQVVGDKCR